MRSVMPGIISAVPRHAWCHPAHFLRIDLGLMTAPLSPQTTAAPRAPGSWWLLLSPANTSLSSEIVTTQPRPRTQIQGVRERARVPQLVMLCLRWAHLQCFAGRTGRTHGTTAGIAGKRTQYRNIRPFQKNLRSQILVPSP